MFSQKVIPSQPITPLGGDFSHPKSFLEVIGDSFRDFVKNRNDYKIRKHNS